MELAQNDIFFSSRDQLAEGACCAMLRMRTLYEICLLCDATNVTSVRDMLCRDNKEICKRCKEKYSIRDTWRSRRKQSQANLLTVVNLLIDIIWSSSRTPSFPGPLFGPRSFLFHP
jgi:transposase-like protein